MTYEALPKGIKKKIKENLGVIEANIGIAWQRTKVRS